MFSQKALKLILDEEGMDQPSLWPGGESGISIGIGYDLRFEENFEYDWKPYLSSDEISRLKTVVGKQGSNELAKQFKDIRITAEAANKVFMDKTLPEYTRQTRAAFPGFDDLPLDAQGALVSLVYNRGPGMGTQGKPSWADREEMRNIRDIIQTKTGVISFGDLQKIADQIRSMKRLKPNNSGLRNRRDHEAELIESCIVEPVQPVVAVEPEVVVDSADGASKPLWESPVKPEQPVSVFQTILTLILNIFKRR